MSKPKPFVGSAQLLSLPNLLIIPPVTENELKDAAKKGEGTEFFRKFRLGDLIYSGQPQLAYGEGLRILNECRIADLRAFKKIHKGGPYYWLGIAAFLLHDHETAVFFFDAAVSEDLRRGGDPVNNSTPALKFIQVEGEYPEQAARPLVMVTQAEIENIIRLYNLSFGRSSGIPDLDIVSLRTRFLRPAVSADHENWRSLATTLISFVLEWKDRSEFLDLRVNQGTAEPFYIHLFKGCVLFESLLKANPTKTPPKQCKTLINVLQHLQNELGIPNDMKIGETELPIIVSNLATADNSIRTAIEFTGKIRNTVGHNLGWNLKLSQTEYQKLFTMVAISNLHAIACLY